MSRGMKGCYVYFVDDELKSYFVKHLTINKNTKTLKESSKYEIHPVLAEENLPFKILPFSQEKPINGVPLYDLKVAAGSFSELQQSPNTKWIELFIPLKSPTDYFVCKVIGESMNKRIPNGSWCLFKKYMGGSREGKIVLVQHYKIQDLDFGSGYTIKSYHSEKKFNQDGSWFHESIILKPLSKSPIYKDIVLDSNESEKLKIIGVFDCVL